MKEPYPSNIIFLFPLSLCWKIDRIFGAKMWFGRRYQIHCIYFFRGGWKDKKYRAHDYHFNFYILQSFLYLRKIQTTHLFCVSGAEKCKGTRLPNLWESQLKCLLGGSQKCVQNAYKRGGVEKGPRPYYCIVICTILLYCIVLLYCICIVIFTVFVLIKLMT